jgi:hypothetical protein
MSSLSGNAVHLIFAWTEKDRILQYYGSRFNSITQFEKSKSIFT